MPLYLFSVLAAPKAVLKQILSLQRNFLWGGKDGHQKWALVAWDTINTPKKAGALGLRDPEAITKVMGANIWWRWVTHQDEPWAMLWHQKYAARWPKKNLIRFAEDSPGSYIWKATQENIQLVQKHSFWEVQDGNSVLFLEDAWQQLPKLNERTNLGSLQQSLIMNNQRKVRDLWEPNRTSTQF